MRIRAFVFAALVAAALLVNLWLVSARVAQNGEDSIRARLAQAAGGFRAQLELIDARLSPRTVAQVPELADATRGPQDPAAPPVRPDDRALRAAASALAPEPDLLAVVNPQGGVISRRARPVQTLQDIAQLPMAKAALDRALAPGFAIYEGVAYRMAAARIASSNAAVIAGTAIDDRLATQMKAQVDADVTLIANGNVVASSLPPQDRVRVASWASAPSPGFGTLRMALPVVGDAMSGTLPRGAVRYAVRATLLPLDSGMQAALTIPAAPYLGWLGRYQALYLLALVVFGLLAIAWILSFPSAATLARRAAPPPAPRTTPRPPRTRTEPELDMLAARPPASAQGETEARAVLPREELGVAPSKGTVPRPEPIQPIAVVDGSSHERALRPTVSPTAGLSPDDTTPRAAFETPAAEPIPLPGRAEPEPAIVLPPVDPKPDPLWTSDAAPDAPALRGDAAAPVQQGEAEWAAQVDAGRRAETEATPSETSVPSDMPEGWGKIEPGDGAEISPAAAAQLEATESAASGAARSELEPELQPEAELQPDSDEAHWREVFDRFVALRAQLGEPGRVTFEKFAAKLAKNRADLMSRRQCAGVRFSVYEKEGRASIKASPVR